MLGKTIVNAFPKKSGPFAPGICVENPHRQKVAKRSFISNLPKLAMQKFPAFLHFALEIQKGSD